MVLLFRFCLHIPHLEEKLVNLFQGEHFQNKVMSAKLPVVTTLLH